MNPKHLIIRILALSLSVVFLLSTFGVSLDFHLCQGKIKTFSFLGDAQKCSEMEENSVCDFTDIRESVSKKKCCSDASIYAKASFQTDFLVSYQAENLNLEVVLNPFQPILLYSTEITEKWLYPPPGDLSNQSILILHQTFLI